MRKILDPTNNHPKYTDKAGVSARYGICPRSVNNFMRRRIFPYVKIGRIVRFDTEKCDRAMEAFESMSVVLTGKKGTDQ